MKLQHVWIFILFLLILLTGKCEYQDQVRAGKVNSEVMGDE